MRTYEQPEDIAHGFLDAWNKHDGDAIAELFVEDANFVNVVGLWWRNREQIRTAHQSGFREIFSNSTMTLKRVAVRHLGDDAAVVHAVWGVTDQNPHGASESGARRGVMSFTVQRQVNGGWLAVSAQNTDRVSGAETFINVGGSLQAVHYGRK